MGGREVLVPALASSEDVGEAAASGSRRSSELFRRLGPVSLAALLAFTSCAPDSQNKQATGAMIGAVAGAVLGAAIGEGKGRVLGAALGAIAGGILGGAIGRYLDEADRARMAQATRTAALTGRDQEWEGEKSGARGTVRVKDTERRTGTVRLAAYKERVESMPPLDLIGDTFEATTRVNVRSGPGTDYRIIDALSPGERVQVIGKVQNADWYVIARDGVASGFVSASYLRPAAEPGETVIASTPPPGAEVVEVSAIQNCRVVVQQVRLADGREIEDQVKVCPGPNGWEVQDI